MTGAQVQNRDLDWPIDNSYAQLPELLHAPAIPSPVRAPQVAILNDLLALQLGLDLQHIPEQSLAALFSGQDLPQGFHPIAQAYAGHQFGGFTMLGDGRAILLGELRTPSGELVDLQLKGAGQTRYSRRGDGRAALGPMLREYVMSEAMFALGIPTTRSLAVVTTGEPVYRESARKGAILTRVAASHIRVGTFEYLAAHRDLSSLRTLADYAIHRHFPDLTNSPTKYSELLRVVSDRQASLIAKWQLVGFIHGVMNTDNMSISGETIDYGPCAFMNTYSVDTVFSSIDHSGRYAYGNQPRIAHWNLARFAETLLPLLSPDQETSIAIATEILEEFPGRFERYWFEGMRRKIGLQTAETSDNELIQSLLDWMQHTQADFTNTFLDLASGAFPIGERYRQPTFQAWYARWQARLTRENGGPAVAVAVMLATNPAVIPRNHRVEEALAAAEEQDDFFKLQRLLAALSTPYKAKPEFSAYQEPPADDAGYQTFCGT